MATNRVISRPSALVRAEHGGEPVHLTIEERKVLARALRLGEDLREELQSKTLEYGRWLLEAVFDDDTSAALDDKSKNPIWQELVRRAGGPTLGITQHLLYTALRIAAHDRRITDALWRGLDAGRKELLLPLSDEKTMLSAARHVVALNLSQKKTTEYVRNLREKSGRPRHLRVTPGAFVTRVKRLRESLGGVSTARRLRSLTMEASARSSVVGELEELRDSVAEMLRALKAR